VFPAEWDKYGKSAGYRRNEQMAQYAEVLVAFWDYNSPGTRHMINLAKQYNLEVHVIDTRKEM
jgi:glycerophosphoryl diester phosphodiesterase